MIQKLNINKKRDNETRIAQIIKANLPSAEYIGAADMNAIVDKINEIIPELNAGISGFQGVLKINEKREDVGFYLPAESGTYTNAGNITVNTDEGFNFIIYDGNKWEVSLVPVEANGKIEEGNMGIITGGEVYKNTVTKEDIKIDGFINFYNNIVDGVIIDGKGNLVNSTTSRIISDLPIDEAKKSITIENIQADPLKKMMFKGHEGEIIGEITSISTIPYSRNIPIGSKSVSFTFKRNVEIEEQRTPIIYYTEDNVKRVDEIIGFRIKAESLSENNNVPYPLTEYNAVNKGYFDSNSIKEESFVTEQIYTSNKLNRDYIVLNKYITGAGIIADGVGNHIIQDHPIEQYVGQLVTLDGYSPESLKKLVFRDESGSVIDKTLSLSTAPFTVRVPDLSKTFDMTIKRNTESSTSVYEFIRMNLGGESLPYEPYTEPMITAILGNKLYAEKAKGAEDMGEKYNQSLNTDSDVEFKSIKTKQLIYSAIQLNLPIGSRTPPAEVELGDAWIDTTDNTIKVKME